MFTRMMNIKTVKMFGTYAQTHTRGVVSLVRLVHQMPGSGKSGARYYSKDGNVNGDPNPNVGSGTESKSSQWQWEYRVPLSEYKAVVAENGKLRAELRASEVYVLLLGTRKRVDNIEKMLAPSGIILSGPRKNRWEKILAQKDNKIVEVFRSEMKKIGLQEDDLSVALSIICQDANERSAHFNIPLLDAVDDSSIESALRIMGIRPDAPLKKAYKLIIQPLKDAPDYFDDD